MAEVKITRASVVMRPGHTDTVSIYTDFPEPLWPFTGKLYLHFETTPGAGEQYVREHFGLDPEVIRG